MNGGHLQSLSLLVVPYNQHPLSIYALPQHLRLSMVCYLDAEHEAILDTLMKGKKQIKSSTYWQIHQHITWITSDL